MSRSLPSARTTCASRAQGQRGSSRTTLLLVLVFLLGIAASAYWFYAVSKRSAAQPQSATSSAPAAQLSAVTRTVLGRLKGPLEVRFYSILDPASVPASVNAFADRVERLLGSYQQEAGSQLKVTRFASDANLSADAPSSDGIQAFNLDKGEPCYLGIALTYKGRKEMLPRLSPDYEQALEADVTRAIARLEEADLPVQVPTAVSPVNTNAVQEVKALVPDVAATSLTEGTRLLQEATRKELETVKKETDVQVKAAEQRYVQAKTSGSQAEQQAARQQLEQAQAEQQQKLAQLYAKSAEQIKAFEQLKAAAR